MICRLQRTHSYLSIPRTHQRRQIQFQSRQRAKHRKKKSQPTGSARQQIGAKDYGGSHTPWHSGKAPPSLLFALSLSRFELQPHAPSRQTHEENSLSGSFNWSESCSYTHVPAVLAHFSFCSSCDKMLGNAEKPVTQRVALCVSVCASVYPSVCACIHASLCYLNFPALGK